MATRSNEQECRALAKCGNWVKYSNYKGELFYMYKSSPNFCQNQKPQSWSIEKEHIILSQSDETTIDNFLIIKQPYVSQNIDYDWLFSKIYSDNQNFQQTVQAKPKSENAIARQSNWRPFLESCTKSNDLSISFVSHVEKHKFWLKTCKVKSMLHE